MVALKSQISVKKTPMEEDGKFMNRRVSGNRNQYGLEQPSQQEVLQLPQVKNKIKLTGKGFSKESDTQSYQSQQPTATSDFMNRFKEKLSTVKKQGHIGVAEDTKEPIKKIEFTGFQSGMSGASMISVNSVP